MLINQGDWSSTTGKYKLFNVVFLFHRLESCLVLLITLLIFSEAHLPLHSSVHRITRCFQYILMLKLLLCVWNYQHSLCFRLFESKTVKLSTLTHINNYQSFTLLTISHSHFSCFLGPSRPFKFVCRKTVRIYCKNRVFWSPQCNIDKYVLNCLQFKYSV